MADAAAASATGTSSTPTTASPAGAGVANASTTTTTQPSSAVNTDPQKGSEPGKTTAATQTTTASTTTEPAKGGDPARTDPTKVTEPAKEAPLFVLPEDFKPPESTVAKFMEAIKTATVDGKFEVTPQKLVDVYVDLARDANTAWQKQIEQLDTDNAAACKARFTPEQLAASESAVGWFASYEPSFRDFAKRQLNDPVFVNAMRLVGEALQEEEFIPAAAPGPSKKTPAQIMGYDKKQ